MSQPPILINQMSYHLSTNQALFTKLKWRKKLCALLACIFMTKQPPHLLILDEPTNHLDLWSIRHIETALNNYQGAMIVISHDKKFLDNIHIKRTIRAPFIH